MFHFWSVIFISFVSSNIIELKKTFHAIFSFTTVSKKLFFSTQHLLGKGKQRYSQGPLAKKKKKYWQTIYLTVKIGWRSASFIATNKITWTTWNNTKIICTKRT